MESGDLTKVIMGALFGFGVIALVRLLRRPPPGSDNRKKKLSDKDRK